MSNSFSSKWKILREELKKLLTRNWGYKLLSLFLAAVIWSVLIAQDHQRKNDSRCDADRVRHG